MVNLPWRDPRFMNGNGVLKSAESSSKTMNALYDLRLHGTRTMLDWCLNMFEKIVAKHFNKSLRVNTPERHRLKESIRRKRPQFQKSDDWYILHDNVSAHQSPTGKGDP
ncbi:hypothetical protein TNCV_2576021 [Trichonephila clavipes]|uniref:Transposase n=1 Tax=Trichonephila clavipes TaxID=2585209 RepID=A0A8X6R695_TRICX|nr:hypothetical protein TNCV_2576021 [Trichonephila clavipes]